MSASSLGSQHVTFLQRIARRSPPLLTHPTRSASTHLNAPLGSSAYGSTIFALSTAPGKAAIAVIRVSGPACTQIFKALCPSTKLPRPRYATVRSLYEPNKPPSLDTILDPSALVLHFPAPRTVTGEDVLELHVHGGPAIVKAVLAAIPKCVSKVGAIRYAEAGEFTRRAFMNDRLDLTQVEALGDTLAATTEQQRRLSVRRTTDRLSKQYEAWRSQLLYARGELEALIDFSEDQHFDESPVELMSNVARQVQDLKHALDAHRQNAVRGELLRNGISISLLGAPNAGKSSLLNRIVGREAAIVSQEAGTTRDVVEVGIDLGGYLCRLGDTAGLRKAQGMSGPEGMKVLEDAISKIEFEGMRRAKQRAAESDVVVVVLSFEPTSNGSHAINFDPEVLSTAKALAIEKSNVVVVINKVDQKPAGLTNSEMIDSVCSAIPGVDRNMIHAVSCRVAEQSSASVSDAGGIQSFMSGMIAKFEEMTKAMTQGEGDASVWQESLGATERHRLLLDECVVHLDLFLREAEGGSAEDDLAESDSEVDIVLAAEFLRSAADCLGRITGRGEAGDVEEVLGVVFEKFCVGK
ncbi:hypothetical protein MBLNU457_7246t1 [Dothideomycetes sp. NU457]